MQWLLPSISSLQPWQNSGSTSQPDAEHVQVEERQLQTSVWGRSTSRSHARARWPLVLEPFALFLAWPANASVVFTVGTDGRFLCQCKPSSSCSCGW